MRDVFAGDEWWDSVSGDTKMLADDEGDDCSFDVISIRGLGRSKRGN